MAGLLYGVPLLALLSGCAASGAQGEGRGKLPAAALDASPVAESDKGLPGSSGRCHEGVCTCRPIDDYGRGERATDGEDVPPPAGLKRYELRTGRGNDEYRITVEGVGTFRKSVGKRARKKNGDANVAENARPPSRLCHKGRAAAAVPLKPPRNGATQAKLMIVKVSAMKIVPT